jgi:hypothetical protein
MSCTLGPVGHGRVGWVLAEGWQRYWADGAADEAVAWSPADGLMGGGFVMHSFMVNSLLSACAGVRGRGPVGVLVFHEK